jgi:polyhydroxyalkanoate synthesis regulator phasin
MKDTNRLEQALLTWERMCFLNGRAQKIQYGIRSEPDVLISPYRHYDEFRKFLLSRNPKLNDKFILTDEVSCSRDITHGSWHHLPQEIHMWSVKSRRIYQVSEDLQQFLEVTSFGNLTWNDVTLPFDAFGISLSSPVMYPGEGNLGLTNRTSDDFLLVTRQPGCVGGIHLYMRLIGIDPAFCPLAKKVCQRIDSLIEDGRFEKAKRVLDEVKERIERTDSNSSVPRIMIPKSYMNRRIEQMFENEEVSVIHGHSINSEREDIVRYTTRTLVRIVIGLCLYLESLNRTHSGSHKHGIGKPVLPSIDTQTLLGESQVCAVTGHNLLSEHDRKFCGLIRKKGLAVAIHEMGAHFRCAYWRRPPGKGDDPSAAKTVHVRSTMVRPDRLPNEGLPPGSETKIG